MKFTTVSLFLWIVVSLFSLASARAQYSVVVVGDPIAQANHSEEIAKWMESIQKLNTQVNQLNQSIAIAQGMKNVMGDPASVAGALNLNLLGSNSLGSSVGQLSSSLNQTANGVQALQHNGQGLYQAVSSFTPGGLNVSYNTDVLKPFAAIQKQTQNLAAVTADTTSRIRQLEQDKAATLTQLQFAATNAETQKLQAKLAAIDGEIASLNGQQSTATNQVIAQDIANRNDRDLKAQAADQAADHEMAISLENFSQWQREITSSRTPFK